MFQLEKAPSTGALHFQGYVRYRNAVAPSRLVSLLRHSHVEVAKGSEQQCVDYCSKDETRVAGPWVFGERSAAGKRNDLTRVREMLAENKGMRDIVQEASSYQSMRSVLACASVFVSGLVTVLMFSCVVFYEQMC